MIAGLPETLRQFLSELQQVNKQLAETNRKMDQVIALLQDDDCPSGWVMPQERQRHDRSE